jgi:hypothetical protein
VPFVPGDYSYIINKKYVHGVSENGTTGENVIYIGSGLSWGFTPSGSVYLTDKGWFTRIRTWNKNGEPEWDPIDVKYPTAGLINHSNASWPSAK